MLRRRWLQRLLFIGGALLLAKGSFSFYPFMFPATRSVELEVLDSPQAIDAEPGSYLFRLVLPRQGARIPVVEGTTHEALRKGAGHLEGSPLPGASGNSVVAGHRDTHFRVLKDVAIGDEITIDTGTKQYTYKIIETRVVPPHDTSPLRSETGQILTLITCYPFYYLGPAPDRFIVRARATGR